MNLDGLRVDHAGLDAAADDLHRTVNDIDARLNRLEQELSPLRSDWTGNAQQAYVAAKARWDGAITGDAGPARRDRQVGAAVERRVPEPRTSAVPPPSTSDHAASDRLRVTVARRAPAAPTWWCRPRSRWPSCSRLWSAASGSSTPPRSPAATASSRPSGGSSAAMPAWPTRTSRTATCSSSPRAPRSRRRASTTTWSRPWPRSSSASWARGTRPPAGAIATDGRRRSCWFSASPGC